MNELSKWNELYSQSSENNQENLLINDPEINEITVVDETVVTGSLNDEPDDKTETVKEGVQWVG